MKKKLEGLNHLNKKLAIDSIRESYIQQTKSSPRNLGNNILGRNEDRKTHFIDNCGYSETYPVDNDDTARFFSQMQNLRGTEIEESKKSTRP